MVVGVATWELHLPGSDSLKAKRSVVKSLKDRLHRQLNLSVAETALQDVLQRAELTACVVATAQPQANSVLDAADQLVMHEWRAHVVRHETTYY